jgi:WD40 repeat protein
MAQPRDSAVGADYRRLAGVEYGPERLWSWLRNPPETHPQRAALLLTIDVGTPINAVACLVIEGKSHALAGCADGVLRLYDLALSHCIREYPGHSARVLVVALSPDGRHALSGSDDHTPRWWELARGVCRRTLQGHTTVDVNAARRRCGAA